jgi:uncharacterized protein (TIGR02996 family)
MNTLDARLAGIVADPLEETRRLVLADRLEENDPRRAELLRLHRKLLATWCARDDQPARRAVEPFSAGVRPWVGLHSGRKQAV